MAINQVAMTALVSEVLLVKGIIPTLMQLTASSIASAVPQITFDLILHKYKNDAPHVRITGD